jgi:ABC-type glutathione transport system ATPase component
MQELRITNLSLTTTVTLFHRWSIVDSIEDFTGVFEAGKIYGIVGELGFGGWLLSYLLSGKSLNLELEQLTKPNIFLDGKEVKINKELQNISCYVGEGVAEIPYNRLETYPNYISRKLFNIKTVAEHIEQGIRSSCNQMSLEEITELFELSGLGEKKESRGRINRPLEFQSGEVWRASMAIGTAYKKKLFCIPWTEPLYVKYFITDYNSKFIKIIKELGATVIIPISYEGYLKNIPVDCFYYLKKPREEIDYLLGHH